MGYDSSCLPDRVLSRMGKKDRPKGKAGLVGSEGRAKQEAKLELKLHAQFWSFLRRNKFEDVQYSNPRKRTTVKAGTPDFLITRGNKRLAIEFKVNGNKLSPNQTEWFAMSARQGNTAIVCYDYESAARCATLYFSYK